MRQPLNPPAASSGADPSSAAGDDPGGAPRSAVLPALVEAADERWNKAKMAGFLRELAATQSVAGAARAVGMSRQSAYKLRNRLKGEPFDIAWEAAFQHGYDALHQAALERALYGTEVPVFHAGELVGTRRHFDERLTVFLLSRRNARGAQRLGRYTAAAEFWSERWDSLLAQVAEGPARWPAPEGAPDADDEQAAVRAAERRHALDEREESAAFGRNRGI